MLNILYLVLLSDINLWFGIIAFCMAPYYIRITNVRLYWSPFAAVFLSSIILSLFVSIESGFVSANLLCMVLYLFKYSFHSNRFSLPPSCVIYVLSSFALLQPFFPDQIEIFRDILSDNRVDIVDYSLESLVGIRFSGIFTNPNYFSIVIILLYLIELIVRGDKFSKVMNLLVLFSVAASGSRAALGCYIIISAFSFIYIKPSRSYFLFITAIPVLAFIHYSSSFDLRIFQVQDFFSNSDPSSSTRTEVLSRYFKEILVRDDYISMLFGQGYSDRYIYFFDGDIGNLVHLFGLFGLISFMLVLIDRYKTGRVSFIIIAMIPFILAGGVFGNLKTLFVFAFLPDFFRASSTAYCIVRNRLSTTLRTRNELRNC